VVTGKLDLVSVLFVLGRNAILDASLPTNRTRLEPRVTRHPLDNTRPARHRSSATGKRAARAQRRSSAHVPAWPGAKPVASLGGTQPLGAVTDNPRSRTNNPLGPYRGAEPEPSGVPRLGLVGAPHPPVKGWPRPVRGAGRGLARQMGLTAIRAHIVGGGQST
jgi:hypothetical protein